LPSIHLLSPAAFRESGGSLQAVDETFGSALAPEMHRDRVLVVRLTGRAPDGLWNRDVLALPTPGLTFSGQIESVDRIVLK
jgi:hypothetical protein